MEEMKSKINKEALVKLVCGWLKHTPEQMIEFNQNHLSGLYFSICSLAILKALDKLPFTREEIANWVYSFQVPWKEGDTKHPFAYGFRGGRYIPATPAESGELFPNDMAHIANSYCALAVLKMCGDDLSRVHKEPIIQSLKYYQNHTSGCFHCLPVDEGACEEDVRFCYCACCISRMLNDFSGIDRKLCTKYLTRCQKYEGGFGWADDTESHSGLTYCAVAALDMMDERSSILDFDKLAEYCFMRLHETGWNGRIGKIPDSCYSFWNLGTLSCIGFDVNSMIDKSSTISFLLNCQKAIGGFSKHTFSKYPDPVHTLYTLCSLSFFPEFDLEIIDPYLVIPVSYTHLTLPTILLVQISVVAVSLKKKIASSRHEKEDIVYTASANHIAHAKA
eukprot:TRINITY_DN58143_c0_g1_i1.p1 TRINITY_DN58143_c0_g1~~TRINITY_DN58143_c0_g1_i1.p1  ORF type:complete len:402 (+),score=62.14 TRINITY_DN58143_c0_g1_i1:36-1208(+)